MAYFMHLRYLATLPIWYFTFYMTEKFLAIYHSAKLNCQHIWDII